MNVVEKSVEAAVKPVESEHPNGEFEVILSTEDLDRDKENLWIDEWKQPLPERIHLDGDHGRSLEKTVGSAVPRIEDGKLIGKGTFAGTEYAQMVRQLVKEGHINSVSVTYAESKNQKGDGVQRELLNAAFVAIPANPKAVVLSSKSAKTDDDRKKSTDVGTMDSLTLIQLVAKAAGGAARSVKHDVMTQALHDAAGTLGAQCSNNIDYQPGGVDPGLKAAGGLSASGNNPQVKHDAMVQAIHDAAYHLGAECFNYSEADPGTDEGANKRGPTGTIKDGLITPNEARKHFTLETSGSKDAGSPQESADEDTAAAAKAAAAVDKSAEDTATVKAKELEKARALAFLISMNTKEH